MSLTNDYIKPLAKSICVLAFAMCLAQQAMAQKVDLNIVAHEDDDILFMNPDILQAVVAGRRQVTVFLTAGNFRPDDLWYAQGREQGAINGYSKLLQIADRIKAGGFNGDFQPTTCAPFTEALTENPGSIRWQRLQLPVGSRTVEVAFTGPDPERPRIMLIFLRLHASTTEYGATVRYNLQNQDQGENAYANLSKLFRGEHATIKSPDGRTSYTKEQLLTLLRTIFQLVRPDTVRTQDSENPNEVDGVGAFVFNGYFYDHSDHYWAARFAEEALRRYRLVRPSANPAYFIYNGYNVERADAPETRLSVKDICFKKSMMYFYGLTDDGVIFANQPSGESRTFVDFFYPLMGHQMRRSMPLP